MSRRKYMARITHIPVHHIGQDRAIHSLTPVAAVTPEVLMGSGAFSQETYYVQDRKYPKIGNVFDQNL